MFIAIYVEELWSCEGSFYFFVSWWPVTWSNWTLNRMYIVQDHLYLMEYWVIVLYCVMGVL